jgi:hypothetical protein
VTFEPPESAVDRKARRQAWRDEHMAIGKAVHVHDGTRATVPAVIINNTGVMIMVRLADGRELLHYDHDVFSPPEAP